MTRVLSFRHVLSPLLCATGLYFISASLCAAGVKTCIPSGTQRVALVIGNGNYQNVPHLSSPPHDADQVATALCQAGFSYVDIEEDQRVSDILGALRRLKQKVLPTTKLVVVYYSGHGSQVQGTTYLLPVDLTGGTDPEITVQSLSLRDIVDRMAAPSPTLARIVIFDACRSDGTPMGTLVVEPPAVTAQQNLNIVLSFASTSGLPASGAGIGVHGNSPFTWAFLKVVANDNNELGVFHQDLNHVAYEVEEKVLGANSAVLPSYSNGIVNGSPYYYVAKGNPASTPPSSYDSEIDKLDNLVLTDATLKSVRSAVSTAGMSSAQLLNAAISALHRPAESEDGRVLTDPFGRQLYAPDFAAAARYFQAASDLGLATASRRLGDLYYAGRGVDINYKRAIALYRTASGAGDLYAKERLGSAYRDGKGVSKDYVQAMQYYLDSAKGQLEETSADIGYLFLMGGGGVKRDAGAALQYFSAAANNGVVEAHGFLGWMYWTGTGVKPNLQTSVDEFHQGSVGGDSKAMEYLARLYRSGFGPRDQAAALLSAAGLEADEWFVRQRHLDDPD